MSVRDDARAPSVRRVVDELLNASNGPHVRVAEQWLNDVVVLGGELVTDTKRCRPKNM